MAKKQIKELVIKTRSPGSKETRRELEAIQKAMEQTESSAKNINRQTGGSIKVLQKVSKEYGEISKSIQTATKAARSFNNALSGDTKTATKRISAYMDNIELLTLSMRDLSEESSRAVTNLDKVGVTTGGTSQEIRSLVNFVEQLYLEMVELNANTRESIETLDRLGDRITDVEVQTKKGRLQTEALGESFRDTSKDAKRYGTSAGKAANDTRRLAGAGSQGARAFSDLAFRMNPIVSLYASIAVNVYAATEAFRLLNEASNLNRLNEQTARFAATLSGIDIKSLSEDLQELSGNALNAGDALRQSVRGVAYGFAADDLERLTAGARRASVALGVNFADAIDRAFRGIAKQEVEVLDEIGVVTRLETAFKKYAATLNKRADDLTEVERRAALTTEVISQLEKRFSSFSTEATGVEQLGVAMQDLVDNSLIQANSAIDELAKSAAALVRGFGGVESASVRVARAQEVYNEAVRAGEISQASVAYSQLQEALELVREEQTKGTKQYAKYQQSVEEAEAAQGVLNKMLAAGTIAAVAYGAALTKSLLVSTVALVAGTINLTKKTREFIKVQMIQKGSTIAATTATTLATTAVKAYRKALTLAFAASLALASGSLLATAPIWLLVGAIAAVVTGVTLLANELSGGAVFSAISDFFGWWYDKWVDFLDFIGVSLESLGAKAKEFGKDAAKFIGDGLDWAASKFGINDLTADYLGLSEAQKEAKMTAEEYRRSLTTLGTDGAILNALNGAFDLTRDQAEANLSYINSSKDLIQQIGTDLNNLEPPQTAFEKFASTLKGLAEVPVTLKVDSNEWRTAENRFKDLQDQGVIPLDLKFDDASGWAEFNSRVQEVRNTLEWFTNEAAFEVSKMSKSLAANDPAAGLKEARMEREQLVLLLDKYSKLGENVAKEERAEVLRNKQLLDLDIARLDNSVKYSAALRAQELSNKAQLGALERRSSIESEILEVQVSQLEAQIVTAKAKNQDVTQLQQELALLKQKLMFSKQDEALQQKEFMISQRMAALEQAQDRAGTERERVAIQKEINQAKQDEINLMVAGIEKQKAQANLDRQKAETERSGNAAGFKDFAAVASSMGGMEGLTGLQSTALNSVSAISDVYGSFLDNMKNSSESFLEFLKGDIQAFGQVAQAGLQFANGVFQQASQAKVDSLNREIEAEKRRDGKSAESKKKLKQLEAKRIKEEAKAKKASVVMSTAAAVMQAMAQIPWPANLAMAAATGVMGMMQISQIDKAAAGQVAGLNDAGGNLSLEGGKRTSEVDVAGSASAGELSYLRGESGTGSISNFSPGRASGNYASAGTSITVGESGPEEITPAMPVNVTPSGSSDGGEKIVFSPVINAQAVDSMGMEELLNRYSQQLYDGLETELRARNKSLDSL